jgi:phage tail-like protein
MFLLGRVSMRSRWAFGLEVAAGLFMVVAVTWLLGAMPAAAAREDPIISAGVKLEVQGGPTGFFPEVLGLGSESEVVEQRSTGPGGQIVIRNVPGLLKWKPIVLKRSMTTDRSLWLWRAQIEAGNVQGATLKFSITVFGPSLQPIARWEGFGGWPSKLIVPSLDPNAKGPAVEELTITHSGLVRTQ